MEGADALAARNQAAFGALKVDRIVTNAAGCGLALAKSLTQSAPVQDVLGFLGEHGVKPRERKDGPAHVFVDLPCHLVHGQKAGIPASVLDATGYAWQLAPRAQDCCGSGGVYNIQKSDNAKAILREKAAFLDDLPANVEPILATANHVCMMQWHTARSMVQRPFTVRHVVQLLDPGEERGALRTNPASRLAGSSHHPRA
jgi:glycolate oxidase iron-sulfur subunit